MKMSDQNVVLPLSHLSHADYNLLTTLGEDDPHTQLLNRDFEAANNAFSPFSQVFEIGHYLPPLIPR